MAPYRSIAVRVECFIYNCAMTYQTVPYRVASRVLRAVVHPVPWLANAGDDENADARRKLRYRSALLRVSVGAGAVTADSVRFESETTNGKSIELHSFVCFVRTDAIIG